MREATKQATLLLLFCLENRLILDTFNCLDLEDSVIAKLWNHIQQFIYNLSFRLYAVFWFWWDIEFGNLLKGLVRRRVLSRGHLYLWRSATRLLRDLSVCSLTEAWNDMLPHFITMDVSMAVCPISAYTKDCVLANAARRWQDWARSTCTGADACCHWKLPPTMGKVGKESKSSGRCAVLRRLWKNWNVQTAGPGRSTDKTERLRGLRSSGPGNIQTGIFDLMDDPVSKWELSPSTFYHTTSYIKKWILIYICLQSFEYSESPRRCCVEERCGQRCWAAVSCSHLTICSCISAFPCILRRGIAIENHKLTADRREGNVKWHCGAHSLHVWL